MSDISFDVQPDKPPRGVLQTAFGLMLLAISLAAAIVNLPSFIALNSRSFFLRIIWRHLVELVILSPFLILDFISIEVSLFEMLSANLMPIFFLSLIYTFNVILVYYAAMHTYVVHTLLLCSIPTTFITLWKIVRRLPFSRLEYVGVALNVFGAYLCWCEGATIPSKIYRFTLLRGRNAQRRHLRHPCRRCLCNLHDLERSCPNWKLYSIGNVQCTNVRLRYGDQFRTVLGLRG